MTTWVGLGGGTGTALAISDDLVAVAELARLSVWSADGDRLAERETPQPNPARPRIIGRHVHWGPNIVMVDGDDAPISAPTAAPLVGYAQTAYVWGPDGDTVVVAGRWTGPPGPPPAIAVLFDVAAERPTVLWSAPDVAPIALWCGRNEIVIGTRSPLVFDRQGHPNGTLGGITSPFRLEADAAGSRLLVAEYATLAVWDLATGRALGARTGAWVDASLTPDGTRVVAADFSGQVVVYMVGADLPIVERLRSEDRALGVATTDHRVVASFSLLPSIRVTSLSAAP